MGRSAAERLPVCASEVPAITGDERCTAQANSNGQYRAAVGTQPIELGGFGRDGRGGRSAQMPQQCIESLDHLRALVRLVSSGLRHNVRIDPAHGWNG